MSKYNKNKNINIMLRQLVSIGIVMLLLDSVFIYGIKDHFNNQIKLVQGSAIKPNVTAIILTYIAMIVGLYYFIIREKKSPVDAALLGLVIYAVYELTSKSLLKKWMWKTVIIDTAWGAILFAMTTFIYGETP